MKQNQRLEGAPKRTKSKFFSGDSGISGGGGATPDNPKVGRPTKNVWVLVVPGGWVPGNPKIGRSGCSYSQYQAQSFELKLSSSLNYICIKCPLCGAGRNVATAPDFRVFVAKQGRFASLSLGWENKHTTPPGSPRLPPEHLFSGGSCVRT